MIDASKEAIAKRLRTMRSESAVTLEAFGAAADTSKQAASGWVRTGRISHESMALLCNEYGYSLLWLMTGQGPKRPVDISEAKVVTVRPAVLMDGATPEQHMKGLADDLVSLAITEAGGGEAISLTAESSKAIREAAAHAIEDLFRELVINIRLADTSERSIRRMAEQTLARREAQLPEKMKFTAAEREQWIEEMVVEFKKSEGRPKAALKKAV